VTIFEALHKPGGVLVYGIPEFRLPNRIIEREIDNIQRLGVKIYLNALVGKLFTIESLMDEQGFSAVYVGTGAGLPYMMNIPGKNLKGVFTANEFLTRVNLMRSFDFPNAPTPLKVGSRVVVVGGGNVAMDAARTALRVGAGEVHLVYRRSEAEMPARNEEIHHAREEGVVFHLLTNPTELHGDDDENLTGVTCVEMELGEPDDSGRRRPGRQGGQRVPDGRADVRLRDRPGPEPGAEQRDARAEDQQVGPDRGGREPHDVDPRRLRRRRHHRWVHGHHGDGRRAERGEGDPRLRQRRAGRGGGGGRERGVG
jgi:glutamate synthase (NADPH/NADH) small chain